jgi:replication-associated recombination protein RarA
MAGEQKPLWRWGDQETVGGYKLDQVASAVQKAIRRCDEEEALYWISELDLSGFAAYAWRRLKICCSEDLGVAWLEGPTVIAALYGFWDEAVQREKAGRGRGNASLFLVDATIRLCRANKSRITDNALNLFYAHRDVVRRPIPDFALDSHTDRGRKMGRTEENHYDESYGLARQALPDPYIAEAHAWMSAEQVARHAEPHEQHPAEVDPK